jgi:antitoxin component of MazEF toxin-antitoxin module
MKLHHNLRGEAVRQIFALGIRKVSLRRPVRGVRGKQSLQELVSRIPERYKTGEIDWGKPVGKEVW